MRYRCTATDHPVRVTRGVSWDMCFCIGSFEPPFLVLYEIYKSCEGRWSGSVVLLSLLLPSLVGWPQCLEAPGERRELIPENCLISLTHECLGRLATPSPSIPYINTELQHKLHKKYCMVDQSHPAIGRTSRASPWPVCSPATLVWPPSSPSQPTALWLLLLSFPLWDKLFPHMSNDMQS